MFDDLIALGQAVPDEACEILREIKFRAWDSKYNRMATRVDLIVYDEEGEMQAIEGWGLGNYKGAICIDTPNFILMQYSGLKDKNGIEIYEGDILENIIINNSITKGQIIFYNGSFCVEQLGGEGLIDDLSRHLHEKVIGNIYEQ